MIKLKAFFSTYALYFKIGGLVVALAVSFIAGKRWEQADRYKDAVKQLAALDEGYRAALTGLSDEWKAEAARVNIEIGEWREQERIDTELIRALALGQEGIRREFREIDHDIQFAGDLGGCALTADAVRLLRAASDAANRNRASED